ncbi:diguanylate cyclase (GGDEF)-like protein [Kineococcus radiotolerans]|uniref:Diguanylate cyclase (GGDEF)-like protein n=1 Tax=Kineococcus radiotolerans TaxID=131568 RepID=A0A7W4XVM2_KINRA|nr:EAL domain-containing protein [Kineococcus radiotolerans]MBB2899462.1 diguanylate cyclase (GGDEF)-like protein [Kineococcus radiotolerans]
MGLTQMWRTLAPVAAAEVADDVFARRTLARVLGLQYVLGGALAALFALVVLPAATRSPVLTCAVTAFAAGAVMEVVSLLRLSSRAFTVLSHACILSAQVVVAAAHVAAGEAGGPLMLFLLWTSPYAGIFSARARWLHVAAACVALVTASAALPGAFGTKVVSIAIFAATLVITSMLTAQMTTRLRRSATQDPLTGLPNRRLLHATVAAALARRAARGGAVAVLLIDLDRFKHVNDTFGHEIGDALLQQVVPRLMAQLGPADVLARLGGDEFAVVCEDSSGAVGPVQTAARLTRVWAEPVLVDGRTLHVSGSIGVALAGDGATPRTLLRDADAAMYESKRRGPGAFQVFSTDIAARTHRLLLLEQGLQRAVERRELAVHYQPVLALTGPRAGHAVGAEALLRWRSAELGPVGPDEFIPVAESAGLVNALGDWVLDRVMTDLAGWRARGQVDDDFQVAVNVSAHQLTAVLPGQVAGLLARHGLGARSVGLEVTETAVVEGGTAPQVLAELRDLGVSLLLDDFGTGYSSLSQLQELPFDVVKVDRSFVAGMTRSARDRALVLAVLNLAEALGMAVVAEGVEEREQAEQLRVAGCSAAQGWYFARAVPAAELPAALQQAVGELALTRPSTPT